MVAYRQFYSRQWYYCQLLEPVSRLVCIYELVGLNKSFDFISNSCWIHFGCMSDFCWCIADSSGFSIFTHFYSWGCTLCWLVCLPMELFFELGCACRLLVKRMVFNQPAKRSARWPGISCRSRWAACNEISDCTSTRHSRDGLRRESAKTSWQHFHKITRRSGCL